MTRILTIAHVVWLDVLRRKDVYVLVVLLLAFLMTLMSLNVFGLGDLAGYVKEVGLLLAWLFAWILSVSISARLLPQEESRGTIFPLLAKPITRFEVVAGKWLGGWTVSCAATIVFYAALVLIIRWRGAGFNWLALAQGLALHLCLLGMIAALGVAFSTRLNYDAAATMTYVVSLAAFLVLPRVPYLVLTVKGFNQAGLLILYFALPHFELFDMRMRLVHNWDPAPIQAVLMVLAYGVVVTIIFLLLGWLGYRNKRFSRGVIQ